MLMMPWWSFCLVLCMGDWTEWEIQMRWRERFGGGGGEGGGGKEVGIMGDPSIEFSTRRLGSNV